MHGRTYVRTDSLAGATLDLCHTQLCIEPLHYMFCSVEGGEGLVTLGWGLKLPRQPYRTKVGTELVIGYKAGLIGSATALSDKHHSLQEQAHMSTLSPFPHSAAQPLQFLSVHSRSHCHCYGPCSSFDYRELEPDSK